MRVLQHLFSGPWLVRRSFTASALSKIETAIQHSESSHLGELRFVVEPGLHLFDLLRGKSARERALEVFSQLRIWDTEHNSGVLIYLLLAERDVEIVADRGIHQRVGEGAWQAICKEMETRFKQQQFEQGAIEGIARITALLQQHFPADNNDNPNELPDAPLIL
ncbi:uncharacterized protein NMK_3118 [Novimethylophilus kurashikiensis]|uniref:TPM domain-containing protein n=1 Tax=Novimethylophilus kurashikiensis TaxID=1825523 RepID=A0A2R5FB93_9PROT|nr:TPM domain-containing protein [Novimethylophilus kurashikiensis]GBG15510.1 uncharacterized protein NMK_3118 [Novimethylophilus kurashikiensis]